MSRSGLHSEDGGDTVPVPFSETANIVLFDAVGTLIYADPPVAEVYSQAGSRFGVILSPTVIAERFARALHANDLQDSKGRDCIPSTNHAASWSGYKPDLPGEAAELLRWHNIVAEVFAELIEPDESAFDNLFAQLWQHFAQPYAWSLFPDVEDCLQQLQQLGIRVGVASNFDARLRNVCAGHPALAHLQVFVSSELGSAKPDQGFFDAIERRLPASPTELTLVGDDIEADYHGALAAGWNAVLLDRNGRHTASNLRSLRDLPALLANDVPR